MSLKWITESSSSWLRSFLMAEPTAPEITIEPEIVVENLAPLHPYYPEGVAIPSYVPNEVPVPVLLAALGGMLAFALLGAVAVALRVNPKLSRVNIVRLCWFVMSE